MPNPYLAKDILELADHFFKKHPGKEVSEELGFIAANPRWFHAKGAKKLLLEMLTWKLPDDAFTFWHRLCNLKYKTFWDYYSYWYIVGLSINWLIYITGVVGFLLYIIGATSNAFYVFLFDQRTVIFLFFYFILFFILPFFYEIVSWCIYRGQVF